MEKVLTIVVPTYNMEEYLDDCLSSMIMDDASLMDALEVIVVNDGSKDSSLEIAGSYKERFPDTFIVIDKENGNYGSCVNRGLKEATGKYFRIVDADDWVDTSALKEFIVRLEDIECDLAITNYSEIKGDDITNTQYSPKINVNQLYDLNTMTYEDGDFHLQMHGMTYKTCLLYNISLYLTEGVSYTDTEYCFFPLSAVNTLIFWDINLYQYRACREGQTMSSESMIKSTNSMHVVALNLVQNYVNTDCGARSMMRLFLLKRILWMYYWTVLGMCKKDDKVNRKLMQLHSKIMEIPILIDTIRAFNVRRVPFIVIWERWNLYNTSWLFRVYNFIYDKLKTCYERTVV